jgi:monofunctional biosynthetic peptidoglycan transglycosylase
MSKSSTKFRRLRRTLIRLAIALLVLPTLIIAAYRFIDPPITPLMVIRLFEHEGLDKDWVPLEQISPHLVNAVIAAEDNRFCDHLGFDGEAIWQQIEAWSSGERPRGASTITMQTAKNILLWPGRDPIRKLIEAWLTPQVELMWSKKRILEVYLNIAEMGAGIYGAEAAAQAYFGKPASKLRPREAAVIAAILPSPRSWSVSSPSDEINYRARSILRRIPQLGPLLACAQPNS